jgi:hypothetical protein
MIKDPEIIEKNSTRDPEKVWIVFDQKEKKGPYTTDEVVSLIETHKIRRTSPIWKKGMRKWSKVNKLTEFSEACYPLQPKEFKEGHVSYSAELEKSEIIADKIQVKEKCFCIVILLLLVAIAIAGYKFADLAKSSMNQQKNINDLIKIDSEIFEKETTK